MSDPNQSLSTQDYAALEFQPWNPDKQLEEELSPANFKSFGEHCRLAYSLTLKTKEHLITASREFGEDEAIALLDALIFTSEQAMAFMEIIDTARIRLTSALSVIAMDGGEFSIEKRQAK
ncbi:hypothetical protein LJR030_003678 [Rhizobium sp. LjRoot30]|uniref:hypothetical protein n=1 Tax=Rhizobium sp. LjRoot30 TaxID=3342320 RepID=UPI003ECF52E6